MKIRQGFVSNSSSSSFIVAFKKVPKTKGQLYDMMFPKGMETIWYYDEVRPTSFVVDRVWEDLKDKISINKDEIFEEVSHGCFDGYPDYLWSIRDKELEEIDQKYRKKYGKDEWWTEHKDWKKERFARWDKKQEEEHKIINKEAEECVKNNFKEDMLKNYKFFVFRYSDNEGDSLLEHGDIFRNLPHIAVSHH